MPPVIAQESDVIQLRQPVIIINQNGVLRPVAKGEETLERGANGLLVFGYLRVG